LRAEIQRTPSLGTVRHVVCARPDYIAANGAPRTPEDLAGHRVISFQSAADGAEIATTFSSRLSVNTIEGAIDAALSGAGLVRAVSYQVAEHVGAGRFALLLEDFEPRVRPVHLVYDSQNRLPLKLRAFVDFVVPRLRQRLVDVTL